MKNKVIMIEESLYEFAKRGRPRKNAKKPLKKERGIDAPDSWEAPEDEEIVNPDELDVDVSDMTDTEDIEVVEDIFDDELLKALNNEVKLLEPNRRIVKFKLKGDLGKTLRGIPMVKMKDNAFLFKLQNGSMKKVKLSDMIVENENHKNRAKTVNELHKNYLSNPFPTPDYDPEYNEDDKDYDSVTYILTDGRRIEMVEDSFPGMAGEPMTVHAFIDVESGKKLSYRDIKNFLNDEDRQEIRDVLDDDEESNHDSAVNWVK